MSEECPSDIATEEGRRTIAQFLMVDYARDITRDNLRQYLAEERPELAEEQIQDALRDLIHLIRSAEVAISWPDEAT
jgi:hypothetical protein